MTVSEAIREVEAFLDGETQSGRLDEETVEAFDLIIAAAERAESYFDSVETATEDER